MTKKDYITLANLLTKHKTIANLRRGITHVIKKGENNMSAHDLNGRCQCLSGGFFESVPEGCDLYMMQKVLHNWNDERCLQILANVKKVLPPKGRLLILDMIIPKNSDFHISRILDFTMPIMLGEGRERTESEFRALLERAGFRLKRIIPLTIVSILEVEPE